MARAAQSARSLRMVTEFAAQQAEFLKHLFDQDDDEFAYLSVIKLQEEVGEVAEAFLALRKVQRREKLQATTPELRAALGREIGDVTIVLSLLADAVGLRFDELLVERLEDIHSRREKLLAERASNGDRPAYKRELPSPSTANDVQLDLFPAR